MKHLIRPRAAAVATMLLAVLTLAACGGEERASADGAAEQRKVTLQLDYTPYESHLPFAIAQERGYFAEEDLDVELVPGKGSQVAIDAVASGDATFGYAASSNVILSVGQGLPVVSTGVVESATGIGVFIAEESGADELQDLRGKQILSTATGPQASLLPALLNANGIDPDAVETVNVDLSALASTYANGRGDAIMTSIPAFSALFERERPSIVQATHDNGLSLPGYSIVATRDTVEQDPELVRRFLRAVYRGVEAVRRDPDAAVDVLVELHPELDAQLLRASAAVLEADYRCTQSTAGAPLGMPDRDDWTALVETLHEHADLPRSVRPGDVYTNEFFDGDDTVAQEEC